MGLRNQEVQESEDIITEKYIQGKQKLVQEIKRFEKSRVWEIGISVN